MQTAQRFLLRYFPLRSPFPSIILRSNRGSALLLAVFFIVILGFLADALLILCPTELQAARQNKFRSQAYYCAEAGIIQGISYIEDQTTLGNAVGSVNIDIQPLDGLYAKVRITPDASNTYNLTAIYHLVAGVYSSSSARGADNSSNCSQALQTIKTFIVQESFSKFAYYSNDEGGCIWREGYQIDGPFHSNGVVQVDIPDDYADDSGSSPIFLGSTSFRGVVRDTGVDPTTRQLNKLLNYQGLESFQEIHLPLSIPDLKELVWNHGVSQPPTGQGVYVQTSGGDLAKKGIYIRGNVDKMTINGNTVLIQQGSQRVSLNTTIDRFGKPLNTYIQRGYVDAYGTFRPDSYDTYTGLGSSLGKQIIYCDGNINNLSGTNCGQKVIAVDLESNKNITISGDIFRADTPHSADYTNHPLAYLNRPTANRDVLGLIAEQILIKDDPSYRNYWNAYGDSPRTWNHKMFNVDIFAVLMAGKKSSYTSASGGFGVENSGNRPPAGYINIYGGLIQGTRGAVGGGAHGFRRRIFYDSLAAKSLNNYFPTLPKFHIAGWNASSSGSGGQN